MSLKRISSRFCVALFQITLLLSLSFTLPSLVSAQSAAPIPTGFSGLIGRLASGNVFSGSSVVGAGSISQGSVFVGEHVFQAGEQIVVNGVPQTVGAEGFTSGVGDHVIAGADLSSTSGANVITTGAQAGGALIQGLFWGVALYAGIKMIGGMLGLGKETTDALAQSALFGAISGGVVKASIIQFGGISAKQQIASGFFKGFTPGQIGFGAGVAITVIVFLLLYKSNKTKVVNYQCLPWEAPLGGASCETCQKNPLVPCSEYRCRSLGQACELVNPGTSEEKCVWVSRGDVKSPVITPWEGALQPAGLRYVPLESRPGARGTKIVKNPSSCLDAYTALEFGILTDEPAQCKLDYKNGNFSSMQFFFGGSNYYLTNHTQIMKLPSGNDADGLILKNDGTFSLYLKCQDRNGNVNEDVYLIEYCVAKGPDTTPPVIVSTSIPSGSPVQYKANAAAVDFYLNEPASCKWSRQSRSYETMENGMTCATSPVQLNGDLSYTCATNLTSIEDRKDNQFYVRCQDPANNTMTQSYSYVLKGTQPLTILSTGPNSTLTGSTSTVKVELTVKTDDGADLGKAKCFFNSTTTGGYTEFANTDSYAHSQVVDLIGGRYTYGYRCIDAGGNIVNAAVNFTIFVDNQAPLVTRTYREQALKIVTNEPAECSYSVQNCNFILDDGLKLQYQNAEVKNQLFLDWKPSATYYIKCVDAYGNQPDPAECSVIVAPKDLSTGETTT